MGIRAVPRSASRTEAVQVLADVVPTEHAHTVPTRTRDEVLIRDVDLLLAERARQVVTSVAVAHLKNSARRNSVNLHSPWTRDEGQLDLLALFCFERSREFRTISTDRTFLTVQMIKRRLRLLCLLQCRSEAELIFTRLSSMAEDQAFYVQCTGQVESGDFGAIDNIYCRYAFHFGHDWVIAAVSVL